MVSNAWTIRSFVFTTVGVAIKACTHWSCQLDCDGGLCPLCRAVQPDIVRVQGTRTASCLEYVDVCHGCRRCFAGFRDGVPLHEESTEVWEDEEEEVLERRRQLLEDAAWYFEESRRREEVERAERKRARRRRYRRRAERLN